MKTIILLSIAVLSAIGLSSAALADKSVPDSETEDFRSVQNGTMIEDGRSFYSDDTVFYYRQRGEYQQAPSWIARPNVPDSESAAWRSVVGIPGGY